MADTTETPILFDEDLDNGVNEFWQMVKNITTHEIGLYNNLTLVATLTPSQEVENALTLNWACDLQVKGYAKVLRSLLQNVNYTSNLHTLVEYEEGVTTHPKAVFATLNCIRKYLACSMIVVDPEEDIKTGTARVFIVPRKQEKTAIM